MQNYHVNYVYTDTSGSTINGSAIVEAEGIIDAQNRAKEDVSVLTGAEDVAPISVLEPETGRLLWQFIPEEEPAEEVENNVYVTEPKAWARIEDDKIAELTTNNPTGNWPEEIVWVEVPSILFNWVNFEYVVKKGSKSKSATVEPPSQEYFVSQIQGVLSNIRKYWQEFGVEVNGVKYSTNNDSINNIRNAIKDGEEYEADNKDKFTRLWKSNGTFIELDLPQFREIKQACLDHVQNCFKRESNILKEIEKVSKKGYESMLEVFDKEKDVDWPGYVAPEPVAEETE